MSTVRTLTLHCIDSKCHCDWRLTLENCVEGSIMRTVNIVNAALSALAIVILIGILYHRLVIKGNILFDFSRSKAVLRPRPVDCLLFFLTLFNILRLLGSLVLVIDVAPTNLIFRSWLFEFSWQFGYGGFALYLVGIAQTLADSHKQISIGWLPSPRMVDVIGMWFFLWPFVINNIFSILAGVFATRNLYLAEICTRLLYVMWFLHNTTLSSAVVYAGYRLVQILNLHIQKFKTSGERYASVKTGIYRIKMVIAVCTGSLLGFASFLFLYGILRDLIMVNLPGSIFLGVVWTFLGVLTTFFVELVILINPKIEQNPALQIKSSTGNTTGGGGGGTGLKSSRITTQTNQSTRDESTVVDHGTQISMPELEKSDVLLQQEQYQQVFRQHALGGPHLTLPPAIYDAATMDDKTALGLETFRYSPDSDRRHLIEPIVKPMHLQWPDTTST